MGKGEAGSSAAGTESREEVFAAPGRLWASLASSFTGGGSWDLKVLFSL